MTRFLCFLLVALGVTVYLGYEPVQAVLEHPVVPSSRTGEDAWIRTTSAGSPAPPDTSFQAFWATVREALRVDDAETLATLIAEEFLVEDVLSITSADAFIELYPDLFPPDVRDVFLNRMPEPSDLVEGNGRVLLWDEGEAQRLFLVLQQPDGRYRLAGFYPYYSGE
jgi:hypothetical protein